MAHKNVRDWGDFPIREVIHPSIILGEVETRSSCLNLVFISVKRLSGGILLRVQKCWLQLQQF